MILKLYCHSLLHHSLYHCIYHPFYPFLNNIKRENNKIIPSPTASVSIQKPWAQQRLILKAFH